MRPAEYDHIPDVRCDPVSILINLAIGIALSAVSALLAPKPRQPEQITQRRLASKNGPSRFNPTYGFDSLAELANYGDPVTIPFGFFQPVELVDGELQTYTGGILSTPKLVWSRMLSYGTHQAMKALYVVGEANVGVPDVNGVWLGNTALDVIYKHQYALYWNTTPGSGRVKGHHLISGTRGTVDAADPWNGDDVFTCPTRDGENDLGFCMTYTPSGNTQFGVHSAIANGTDRRVNWRVVSIPKETTGESRDALKEERRKVSGSPADTQGGVGVGYGRLMGLVEVDGYQPSKRELVVAKVGSTAVFKISGNKYDKDMYSHNVSIDDVADEAEQERVRADERMQVGEKFMIGKSVWKVTSRTPGVWRRSNPIRASLECVEVFGDGTVGVIPEHWLARDLMNKGYDLTSDNHVQINFYPLLGVEFGLVRNQRIADVTEIGIRSTVWNQFSGLCNFKSVPTPNELKRLDEDNVQLTGGSMNLYFRRYSYFQVLVRPAGDDQYGQDYGWEGLGEEFCIRGASPIEQFNYIRIKPEVPGQWEFKLAPLSCAYITRKPETAEAWLLDAKNTNLLQRDYQTPHGRFTIVAPGEMTNILLTESSNMMYSKGREPDQGRTEKRNLPVSVYLNEYNVTVDGRAHGYRWEIFGDPMTYSAGESRTVSVVYRSGGTATKAVRVRMTATCVRLSSNNQWGQRQVWGPPTFGIEQTSADTTTNWIDGETGEHSVRITISTNPYIGHLYGFGIQSIIGYYRISVAEVPIYIPPVEGELVREFEHDTQIAEVSHYGDLVRRSCDQGPEHQIAYVNESIASPNQSPPQYSDLTMMGLVLRTSRTFTAMDQPRLWLKRGVKVPKLIKTNGPDDAPIESSNNFAELVHWLLTDQRIGMGNSIHPDLVDKETLTSTARFLEANRIYFDGALEERRNVRAFLAETAPLMLCNFVIKNGQFSLTPAVPTDDAGLIANVVVPIAAMFSSGNIIDDSFEVSYLDSEERRDFQASVRYRRGSYQQLPEERTVVARWKDADENVPQESFDLTPFCTRRGHASMVARYMLSIRRRVDHTITFRTTPVNLALAPGEYIKVFTEANPYNPALNGVVLWDGTVTSPSPVVDGTYSVTYYKPGMDAVVTGSLTVADGKATDPNYVGAVFHVRTGTVKENVYLVEQLTLGDDGLVEIVASYFPVDADGRSLIAQDVLSLDQFILLP